MIPYLDFPVPKLGPLEIHAFGVLVALGILFGSNRVRHRGRQIGLPDDLTSSVSTWIVLGGLIGGHILDVVFYQPQAMRERPWILLNPTAGLSSFGGFFGALVALLIWRRKHGVALLPYVDALLYGLAFGWFFGRLGCFTAHDHPGRFTDFFLAVNYPDGARHDLGLDEALFAGVLAGSFALLSLRPRPVGMYGAIACLFYGPVRFALDFLRVHDVPGADPRYAGLTPAQYGAVAVTLAGVWLLLRVLRAAPETPAA